MLSKGQHLAYGLKFEVKKLELPEEKDESVTGKYDLNKLKVGFAKPIPEKHLSLFIKTQLKNSSFDLQFAGSTVIITFNSALGVNGEYSNKFRVYLRAIVLLSFTTAHCSGRDT